MGGAGTIEGMTLEPGLYKWGSNVGFTNLWFNGTGNDSGHLSSADPVWILQMTGDLNVGAGAIITLEDGAKAENLLAGRRVDYLAHHRCDEGHRPVCIGDRLPD